MLGKQKLIADNKDITYKKELLKQLIALSVPAIIEQVLSTLLQYVDTAMVGHLGERATASVSVTTTVTWLVGSIPSAISVAVLAMLAKAVGGGEQRLAKGISKQAFYVTVVCGIIMGGISIALSPYIPVWMGAEKSVRKQASLYFFIISIPMVFRVSSSILGAAIRATQDTRTPMIISMCANGINVILNVVFIYVLKLGVTGAAIASAVSYSISGILMFIAYRRNEILYYNFKSFCVDTSILKEGAKLSLPVLGSSMVSCLGYVFFAGMVSGMGTTVFAAHSIAVTAETIFYIPGYGLRTAASTLVGVSLGERNHKKFETVSKLSIMITVGMMCISGLILYFVSYPLMCLFTNSAKAAVLGADMLKIVAFSEPFFGLMIVMEGIFYGLGKTGYAFFAESFCMWGIRIASTFLCVQIWHLGLDAVWYCMVADNVCKAFLFTVPVLFKKGRQRLLWDDDK